MADLSNLIVQHAYWSDLRKGLKKLGMAEAAQCQRMREEPHDSCIGAAYKECHRLNSENPYEGYSFDEAWAEIEPCEHCIAVRNLKAERMQAGRRLGAIRAAMTMVGRRLIRAGAKCPPKGAL